MYREGIRLSHLTFVVRDTTDTEEISDSVCILDCVGGRGLHRIHFVEKRLEE